jgi:peptide/nickel transport system permease protein
VIGAIAGISRSRVVDGAFQVIVEAINAFPFIILVIGVVSMVGAGIQGLLIGLIAFNWARYARVVRARTLSVRQVEYLEAARVLGYSRTRILLRHVLPNVSGEAAAYALSDFVLVVITVSGLSYLGLGVQPPTSEWGAMMADGRLYLQRQWWLTVMPGLVLCAAALGVAILAQGARLRSEETWLAR